jgi:hypothetical protein
MEADQEPTDGYRSIFGWASMISSLRKIPGRLNLLFKHYKRLPALFHGFDQTSYNGGSAKSKLSKRIDYLYIFFILKIMPNNYHLFCFDAKERSEFKNYMGDTSEPLYYRKMRTTFWSHSILIHDKYLFKSLCRSHNLPVPQHFGIIKNLKLDGNGIGLPEFMRKNNLKEVIVKPVFGGGGRGIHLVSINEQFDYQHLEDLDRDLGKFMEEGYLVEELIKQHPDLDKINPYTLNSIRIVTILCHDGSVEFLGAIFKTNSTNAPMDNFSQGGVVVGIDMETGRLKANGIMQYPEGKILQQHPLTQTPFLDFQIPYWKELKETSVKLQKVFHHIKSVGWDIAISPEGPVIIEGNQEWGTNGLQAANGGLLNEKNRALFESYGVTFYE